MVSNNEDNDSVFAAAVMCLNKTRQFIVGNAEPATAEYPLYSVRCHQLAEQSKNMYPELVQTLINMPVMIEDYYSASGGINMHNNQRQDHIETNRKIRTKD